MSEGSGESYWEPCSVVDGIRVNLDRLLQAISAKM